MSERVGRPLRPERLHSAVSLLVSLALAFGALCLFHWAWTGWHLLAAWLIGVNATTFGYFGFDKRQARKGGRRVPEVVLHGLAFAGGSVGAFAAMGAVPAQDGEGPLSSRLFRHRPVAGRDCRVGRPHPVEVTGRL